MATNRTQLSAKEFANLHHPKKLRAKRLVFWPAFLTSVGLVAGTVFAGIDRPIPADGGEVTVQPSVVADFGDAPDPTYPSLLGSGGVHHLDTTREWIGLSSSVTSNEGDSNQVDLDLDDDISYFVRGSDAFGNNQVDFTTVISYNGEDPTLTRYLNVILDIDDSGSWDEGREWVVQNYEFSFDGLTPEARILWLGMGVDPTLECSDYENKWMRVTLSTEMLPDGTGQWGELARGETEDRKFADCTIPLNKITTYLSHEIRPQYIPTRVAFGTINTARDLRVGIDAKLKFNLPSNAIKPMCAIVKARRNFNTQSKNIYSGNVQSGGGNILALPVAKGVWTAWSPWVFYNTTGDKFFDIVGSFTDRKKRGYSSFSYRIMVRYDPEQEFVQYETGAMNGDILIDCLELQVSTLVAGLAATFDVSDATPGERVAIVYGFQPGTTVVNGVAGYCATFDIQGVRANRLICQRNADGAGNLSCRLNIPGSARGIRLLSQAAERNTCDEECVSNLDDQVIS